MWFKSNRKDTLRFQNRLIIFLALVKLIVPYLLQHPVYEPHRDEFLYLAEGTHLAWGYLEVPPFLSLFSWLTHLFGNSLFWIKFWPSMMGVFTFIFCAKIVQSLGGRAFAILLTFLPFIFGAYLSLFFLFQPNSPEVLFYTIMAYGIIRFIQTQKNRWLYVFGIAAGLGMLSKYSIVFFIASLLIGLLITNQRKIFANRHFYFAGILGFLIFLPNLWWQYQHNFPLFIHMDELKETQLKFNSPISFLQGQILMNLPVFFVWIAGLYFVSFSARAKKYRFLAITYVLLLLFLIYFQGKSYYALGIYPALFAMGAYYLESITDGRSKAWRYAMVAFPVFLGILLLPVALPLFNPESLSNYYASRKMEKYGILRWEDHKDHLLPQDFADMLSWREMSDKVAAAWSSLSSEEKNRTIIIGGNYGQAGALNYYGAQSVLPEVYSTNGSFLLWWPTLGDFENIILVTDETDVMDKPYTKSFKSAFVFDKIENRFARENGSLIVILKGASAQTREGLRELINSKKVMFTRQKK